MLTLIITILPVFDDTHSHIISTYGQFAIDYILVFITVLYPIKLNHTFPFYFIF